MCKERVFCHLKRYHLFVVIYCICLHIVNHHHGPLLKRRNIGGKFNRWEKTFFYCNIRFFVKNSDIFNFFLSNGTRSLHCFFLLTQSKSGRCSRHNPRSARPHGEPIKIAMGKKQWDLGACARMAFSLCASSSALHRCNPSIHKYFIIAKVVTLGCGDWLFINSTVMSYSFIEHRWSSFASITKRVQPAPAYLPPYVLHVKITFWAVEAHFTTTWYWCWVCCGVT